MVLVLNGKMFVLKATSVYSNVVPSLNRSKHCVFLCLLGIMKITAELIPRKRVLTVSNTCGTLKHQTKIKIISENKVSTLWKSTKGG